MGYFTAEIITNKGLNLFATAEAGEKTLVFTKIETGDGDYSPGELASDNNIASLKNKKQSFEITALSIEEATIRIKTVLSNEQLTEGYYIKEIGIYGKLEGGEEHLIAISVCTENPTYLPPYDSFPIEIPFTDFISHANNTGNFTIHYQSGVYATKDELTTIKYEKEEEMLCVSTGYDYGINQEKLMEAINSVMQEISDEEVSEIF